MKFISKLCFHILKPPTRSVLFKFEETLDFDHPMTREPRIFGKRRGTFWGAEPGWKTLVKPGWKAPTTLDEIGIWGPYIQYNIVQLCGDIVYSMYIVYLSIFIYIYKCDCTPQSTICPEANNFKCHDWKHDLGDQSYRLWIDPASWS